MPNFLLVDDHSVVRAGIKLIITQHFADTKVWEAENEKHAVDILRTSPIDVILMDLNMPDSDPIRLIYYITTNIWNKIKTSSTCRKNYMFLLWTKMETK